MQYTVFHIGMYATLCTVLISVLGLKPFKFHVPALRPYLGATLVSFLLAAAFGGLVGSSLPYFPDFESFSQAHLGPWNWELIPAMWCTHLEHTAFWIGIFSVLIVLWCARCSSPLA